MKDIQIANKTIGTGHPCFLIAELGYNFTSLEEALDSIDKAAEAGVDSIKVQTFQAETIVAKGFDFPEEAGGSDQFEEFKRYEITEEQHTAIFQRARSKGLIPFSTPSHAKDVELLERVGCDIYKVGSDDLTNIPFLTHVAKLGKPMIFSSGMGSMEEVSAAVDAIKSTGNDQIILLQCTSNYPIKDLSLVNLRVMETYRKRFDLHTGYSDHTDNPMTPALAAALGAVVVERHYTPDKNNGAPDSYFSADPKELTAIVQSVRNAEIMLGTGEKTPTKSETEMRQFARKSAIARNDIPAGHKITADDIVIKRPAIGVPPAEIHKLFGKKAKKAIAADEPITWDCV